jgi:hypothetical protein
VISPTGTQPPLLPYSLAPLLPFEMMRATAAATEAMPRLRLCYGLWGPCTYTVACACAGAADTGRPIRGNRKGRTV